MSKDTMPDMADDDFGRNSVFANPDRVAAVRLVLGLKPDGYLSDDEAAFKGIVSDVVDAALKQYVECPERVRLLFEQEKINMKLLREIQSEIAPKGHLCDDVALSKIRDRFHALKAEYAKSEEAGRPEGVDPTLIGSLLRSGHAISKRLAALESRKTGRAKR